MTSFPLSLSFLHLNYKERVNLNEESQRTKRKEEKAKWNEKKVSVTHASFPFTLPFSPSFPLSFRSFTLSLHFIVMSGEEREKEGEWLCFSFALFMLPLCSIIKEQMKRKEWNQKNERKREKVSEVHASLVYFFLLFHRMLLFRSVLMGCFRASITKHPLK